jgi:hypothetical protein
LQSKPPKFYLGTSCETIHDCQKWFVAIIVPFNAAWLNIAKHVDCSLKAAGVTKVFCWALDEKAETLGRQHGLNTYYDDRFTSTSDHAGLFSDAYLEMMRQIPRFWLDVLNAGYDMVFLDADIIVLQDPVEYIAKQIATIRSKADKNVSKLEKIVPDIIMQIDGFGLVSKYDTYFHTEGCAGFFYMRSTNGMKIIMRKLAYLLDHFAEMSESKKHVVKKRHWNDQTGLQFLLDKYGVIKSPGGAWKMPEGKKPLVMLQFFDQFDIANGHVMFHYKRRKAIFATRPKGAYPVLVHANVQHDKLWAFKALSVIFFKDEKKKICKESFDKQAFLARVLKKTTLFKYAQFGGRFAKYFIKNT